MLQASPHAYHFKRIFSFGEGQGMGLEVVADIRNRFSVQKRSRHDIGAHVYEQVIIDDYRRSFSKIFAAALSRCATKFATAKGQRVGGRCRCS